MTEDEAYVKAKLRLAVAVAPKRQWMEAIEAARLNPGSLAPLAAWAGLSVVQERNGRVLLVHDGDIEGGVEIHLGGTTSKKIPGSGAGHGV